MGAFFSFINHHFRNFKSLEYICLIMLFKMESITIHPVNKKQIKALTEIARALNVDFQINENKEILKEDFFERFRQATSLEESKDRTLKYAKSLWEK